MKTASPTFSYVPHGTKGARVRHSKDSTDRFYDYNLHIESRTIWIGSDVLDSGEESGVNVTMAERVLKGLHLLSIGPKSADPITIKMANPGGDWYYGMAIHDAMLSCPAPITIEASGLCMSMATIMLQAADQRLLHPNCRFMIHDGQDGYHGNSRDFERWAKNSKELRHVMYQIYANRSGKPVGYWEKKCAFDAIMSAEQAVREGLADSIILPVKQLGPKKLRRRKA